MILHKIRLHTPWEFEWLSGGPASGRARIPAEWSANFGERRDAVLLRRKFHWPNPPNPDETVWLVFDGLDGAGTVQLDSRELGQFHEGQTTYAWEITPWLARNLEIFVSFRSATSASQFRGIFGDVILEIRDREGP